VSHCCLPLSAFPTSLSSCYYCRVCCFGIRRRYPALSRALLKSAHLKEAFAELGDLPGAANIEVTMAPAYPYFRLAAAGSGGSCAVDFPQGSESFISFESSSAQTYRFHASLLQCAVKALTSAEETFLRLNDQGMLCVNHKIVNADSKVMYVSFIVLPDLPEDDEHTDAQSRPSTYNRTNTTGTSGGIDTTTE
jgi:Repair protein Rad1/Rec1/Rad17